MKIKILNRSFPLLALSLIVVGVVATLLTYNQTTLAVSAISSDQRYGFSDGGTGFGVGWMLDPPLIRDWEGYGIDAYFEPVPGPISLDAPWYSLNNVKEIDDPEFNRGPDKQFYDAFEIDGQLYALDFNRSIEGQEVVDYRAVTEGRNVWLLSYFAPKILGSLAVTFLSLSFAFALIVSYRKGSLTKRNITLVKISAFVLGGAVLSHFLAKGIFLLGISGSPFGEWFDWPSFLIGSVLPALFILAIVAGVTNIVTENMKKSFAMKEEIDGTV